MELIDKDALVAEIEKRKREAESNCGGYKSYDEHRCNACIVGFYEEFLEILDTLEVKEVDLDYIKDELDRVVKIYKPDGDFGWGTLYNIATHFFELGLKAQKGEDV